MVILKDDIIGDLSLEDLILSITMIKNDIEIILITEQDVKFDKNKNIVKVVNDKINYVKIVNQYLLENVYINNIKVTNKKDKMVKMQTQDDCYTRIWRVYNNGKSIRKIKRRIDKEKTKEEIIYELPIHMKDKLKEEVLIELKLKENHKEKVRIKIDSKDIKVTII